MNKFSQHSTDQPGDIFRKKLYSPGAISQLLGLSVETLRLYEREGLFVPYKLGSGHRRYTDGDIEWLSCIQKQIHENKLNFAGIRYLLAMLPCHEMKPCSLEDRMACPAGNKSCSPCWDFEHTPCRTPGQSCRSCIVYQQVLNIENLKQILEVKFKCD
jgi:MerR family transcriptional regulator, heat shock protein HspR